MATTTWDPDGPGPLPEWLVVGGQFSVAGNVPVANVAAWDGRSWHALGEGLGTSASRVFALTVYNGQLIAGGSFQDSGDAPCRFVARFDGIAWRQMGTALGDIVQCLAVYNGQLLAGGSIYAYFPGIPSVRYIGVVAWDGSEWNPVGAAEWPGSGIPNVGSMIVYDGQLVIAGDLGDGLGPMSCIARWDGQSWQPLGEGFEEPAGPGFQWVADLVIHDGELVAAHVAEWWDEIDGHQGRGTVAAWDGRTWRVLSQDAEFVPDAFTIYNGELVCSGRYPWIGGAKVGRWDGRAWQFLPGYAAGDSLCVYNGDLIVGGYGVSSDGLSCSGVGRWDGWAWRSLSEGMNWYLTAVGTLRGDMVVAGTSYISETSYSGLLRRDGQGWKPMAPGLTGAGAPDSLAATMLEHGNDLVIGGWFTHAGDVMSNGIVRWDGQAWQSLNGGVTRGVEWGAVQALVLFDGDLIAGGYFDAAGGVPSKGVARWDGRAWHAMDAGMTSYTAEGPSGRMDEFGPSVAALAIYNGELIAGGEFGLVGLPRAVNVARWDGSRWQPLGSGVTGPWYSCVNSLAVYRDQLVVAGRYNLAGDVPCDSIAAWDGTQWHALSGPRVMLDKYDRPSHVGPLAVVGDRLFAAGPFKPLDPTATLVDINSWDGHEWRPLGSGTNGSVWSMVGIGQELVICGGFTVAGGRVSSHVAVWGPAYPGDVSGDGHVDITDLLTIVENLGKGSGDSALARACDLDGNGIVEQEDVLLLASDWGR